jgi:Flp pilus assembly protein TadB
MVGVGLALVIVGIVFLFLAVPWVGIPVGVVGVVLLIAFLLGFGRHPRDRRTVTDDRL